MRQVILLAAVLVIAALSGIGSAWYAVRQGQIFGAVAAGGWTAWPQTGSTHADPYSLAMLARTGELPLGASEGLAFSRTVDNESQPLRGGCVYRVAGDTPAARLWTLTAYDDQGRLMANAPRRPSYHSREILRGPDGRFAILVASEATPGNWLPIGEPEQFSLVLRLYDTPLTTGSQIGELVMPTVERLDCT